MGGIYKRKGNSAKNKQHHRMLKTKSYKRANDQIHDDIKPQNIQRWQNQPIDETLPGLGQYYCVSCARYFVNEESIKKHQISKQHKKQEKRVKEKPYTHMEAEQAGK
ncbi:unnamed protein product [Paramecium octaurelia]|uniref:C2H2-type domain-containing protein n=1 Tax=Paramecium octaurelia TaxID=43137 RepID=A0A8S1RYI9_PAROT|nr:unnamed protein product [Paramecium octaurelia]